MAKFDQVFAELQSKISAVVAVIAQDPALAQQVRDAIDNAQTEAEIAEQAAQDEARANALSTVITDVRGVLAQVAPRPEDTAPEPPVVEEQPAEPPTEV